MRHRPAIGFGLVTLLAAVAAQAADKPACKPAPLGTAQVRSVIDGRTVQLTDGREVRLAGIEVPQNAKAALETLVSGRDIALLRLGADSDRYGRVVALVSVEPGAAEIGQSVQRALLAQGQARVTANLGDSACAASLLEAERVARAADPALAKAAHNAVAKIAAVLPAGRSDEVATSGLVAGPIEPALVDRVNLASLRGAIRTEQKVWIAYHDRGGAATERRIWPISITFCARVRLLAAWCELRESYRHFRTDRIAGLAEIGERYPRRRRALIKEWREMTGLPGPA